MREAAANLEFEDTKRRSDEIHRLEYAELEYLAVSSLASSHRCGEADGTE